MTPDFSHFDAEGQARMVDISGKASTDRMARAEAWVVMQPETLTLIRYGSVKKGDVLGIARLAGIMAAKRTADLIPLCHSLSLTSVKVDFTCDEEKSAIHIVSTCRLLGRTGVEMEALIAASVAALTIYDMCKSADKGMVIQDLRLVQKSGGKSAPFQRAS